MASRLCGRDREWRQLLHALDTARAGHGRVLLVEGGRGIGKTRFLREAVRAAGQRSFTVLERPPVGPAAPGPVLVALDDVPCADPAWLPALAAMPAPHRPLIWLLTRPAGAGGPPADRLLTPAGAPATRIGLGPLPGTAVADLVADLLGAAPHPDLSALVAGAGGNPRLIVELIEGLREEHRLQRRADTVRPLSTELPQRVHAAVRHQVGGVSAKARQLLQVAAALGKTFALHDVADLLRDSAASLLPALEEALATGALVCAADRLAFCNDLVWQAVAESVPASVRQTLHREVGLLLVNRADLTRSAGPAGSARTGPDLAGPDQPGRDPAGQPPDAVTAVDAQLAAGHLASAAALAEEALAQPLPALPAAELRCRLAHILVLSGQVIRATDIAAQPLAQPGLPDHIYSNAAAARVLALSLHDESRAGCEAQAVLARRAGGHGDPAVLTAATVLSNLAWERGDLAESLRLAREAVDGIRAGTPPAWRAHARLALARKLSNRREFGAAEAIIEQTRREIAGSGLGLHSAAPAIARARLLAQSGRLAQAAAEARRALSAAQELGAHLLIPLALSVLATVALRTGDLLTAAEYVRQYRTGRPAGGTPLGSVQYDWVQLLLAYEQDGPRRAAALLTGEHAGLPARPVLYLEEPGAAAWLVRLARAAGDPGLAGTTVDTVARMAAQNPDFPDLLLAAEHARGLRDGDVAALTRAANEHRDPWAAAWAAEDLGVHLVNGAGNQVGAGVAQLALALRRYGEMGAERDAARVRKRLRALGVRRRGRTPSGATSGWVSLNDTERTIAHLVNQGLTNRQIAMRVFLSPHTVNYHLRQIFRKLDINSRVELARLTQERCATPAARPVLPDLRGHLALAPVSDVDSPAPGAEVS